MSRRRLINSLAVAVVAALLNLSTSTSPAAAEAPSPVRVVSDVLGAGFLTHSDRVLPFDTDRYDLTFWGGEDAIIIVDGDGDTDLDCRVYDENGNLVASDTDRTDYCVLEWTPIWTGPFRLTIQNLGSVSNYYTVRTN